MAIAFRGKGRGRSRVEGLPEVISALNVRIARVKGATRIGMSRVALVVMGESVRRTPVKTGNLRGSAYQRIVDSNQGPVAEIGYTANYAWWVHEIDKVYKAPGTHWKFLQTAVQDLSNWIVQTLATFGRGGLR